MARHKITFLFQEGKQEAHRSHWSIAILFIFSPVWSISIVSNTIHKFMTSKFPNISELHTRISNEPFNTFTRVSHRYFQLSMLKWTLVFYFTFSFTNLFFSWFLHFLVAQTKIQDSALILFSLSPLHPINIKFYIFFFSKIYFLISPGLQQSRSWSPSFILVPFQFPLTQLSM